MKPILQTSLLLSLALSAYGLKPSLPDASGGNRAIDGLGSQVHETFGNLMASNSNSGGGRGRRRSLYAREADPEANYYEDGSHALSLEKRVKWLGWGFERPKITIEEHKAIFCKGKLQSKDGKPPTQQSTEWFNKYCGFPLNRPARRSLHLREAEAGPEPSLYYEDGSQALSIEKREDINMAQRQKNFEQRRKQITCKFTGIGCKKKEYVVRDAVPKPHYYEERYAYTEPGAGEYNLYERDAYLDALLYLEDN
ncbi:hypothetical protein MMC30_009001 [Trapelia coarctata]|nr:hypothetical protein [Trapelia coarctata]